MLLVLLPPLSRLDPSTERSLTPRPSTARASRRVPCICSQLILIRFSLTPFLCPTPPSPISHPDCHCSAASTVMPSPRSTLSPINLLKVLMSLVVLSSSTSLYFSACLLNRSPNSPSSTGGFVCVGKIWCMGICLVRRLEKSKIEGL